MIYKVNKTFGHNEGLSCCFRQWRADSHCNLLHGYALSVSFILSSNELDHKNWVYDFGSFKKIKEFLHFWFDHTTVVAKDDPEIEIFKELDNKKLINLKILDHVGCEKFSEFIYNESCKLVPEFEYILESVMVKEHNSNGAIFSKGDL